MKLNNEHFKILKKIEEDPDQNQRSLAANLNLSLGKINYCLKDLKKKGLIKVKNFKKNKNKLGYMYYLTPKGFSEKTNIAIRYFKRVSEEYEMMKKDKGKKL